MLVTIKSIIMRFRILNIALFLVGLISILTFSNCKKKPGPILFSIQDDIQLGQQVKEEINGNPSEYPVLDEAEYAEAYAYLRGITNKILNSGELNYKDEFAWEVYIIGDDNVLNAFAAPGGYIYVYTGLIKYLDKEDDLSGVLGHEIAHADLRHSTRQLEKMYGLSFLLSIVAGENSGQMTQIAGQIAGSLAGLSFSRAHESEADEQSVVYLAKTEYQCNGAYSFFQKLLDNNQDSGTPEFLSTHPDPADRVDEINEKAAEIGCDTTPADPVSYQDFKNSLP